MNMLVNAMQVEQSATTTTNGMKAYELTGSKTLDLFAKIGDARMLDLEELFKVSYRDNPEVTVRMLLWARDVRGGAGERDTARKLLKVLAKHKTFDKMQGVVNIIPEVGRWDDLFELVGTKYESMAFDKIAEGIKANNGLCAKWMPRKGMNAEKLRAHLGFTPKQYRKTLVTLTQVVEQQMCAGNWSEINYEHVPSRAIGIYAKAFKRQDEDRFTKFKQKVASGEAKINAGAVFPYDVVNLMNSDQSLAEVQWKALPDYVQGSDERAICVVDVSGSMEVRVSANSNVSAMDVAISLGIYTAERIQGAFHNSFITFTDNPRIIKFDDNATLAQKLLLAHSDVGYSTNLERVFDTVLNTALKHKVPESELPTKIILISDTQFNSQVGVDEGAVEMVKQKYLRAGYKVPQVVFWNVAAGKYGNTPVTAFDEGVAMVSGFSPAILKSILNKDVSPEGTMLDTVMVDRYNYLG